MTTPQLHLITPLVEDPSAFRPRLTAVLASARPASVHLRVASTDPQAAKRHLQVLASLVQDAGAALLIDAPADLREVARLGADGIHVADPSGLPDALKELKPDRIVGVGGLRTRDDAMTAGELGADYVMFGEPRADGSLPRFDQVLERCQWWAEVFNVPCIGYAPDPAAVKPLVATGADFLALGGWAFADNGALAEVLAALG